MTFEEALEAMKKHKVVRRKVWVNSKSITTRSVKKEMGNGLWISCIGFVRCDINTEYRLTYDDIINDDWDIIPDFVIENLSINQFDGNGNCTVLIDGCKHNAHAVLSNVELDTDLDASTRRVCYTLNLWTEI